MEELFPSLVSRCRCGPPSALKAGRTKGRVYQEARRNGFEGRSKMSKAELEQAAGR